MSGIVVNIQHPLLLDEKCLLAYKVNESNNIAFVNRNDIKLKIFSIEIEFH